jgi:hypothetical protein
MSFNPPIVYKLCRDCLHKTVTSANTGNVIHRVINLFSFINEFCQPSSSTLQTEIECYELNSDSKLWAPQPERVPSLAL